MSDKTSRLPGFHRLNRHERLAQLVEVSRLDAAHANHLADAGAALGAVADHLAENVIGTLNIPLALATNLIVDGVEQLVTMATEESSVVAAVCNGARQCRVSGGLRTSSTGPLTIAQVQIDALSDPFQARAAVYERRAEIEAICAEVDPMLVELGGGLRDIELRVLEAAPPMLVLHLIVDTRDAMGANAVNSMAEALAPRLAAWTGGKVGLRILSNLADRRLVRARAIWPCDEIGGADVRDGILRAAAFAGVDPYRATTHNKGIMNGVTAVVLATGNDTRAVEAGAHAYAARRGSYGPLTRWEVTAEGDLAGSLEMPLSVGIVGGATRVHPTAQACLAIMGIETGDRLARVAGAVGLVQNFSALKALATEGIQRGHMSLHAKNLAIAAGAEGAEIEAVAARMVEEGRIRADRAAAILKDLRD